VARLQAAAQVALRLPLGVLAATAHETRGPAELALLTYVQ
jgi:hypothetical protein